MDLLAHAVVALAGVVVEVHACFGVGGAGGFGVAVGRVAGAAVGDGEVVVGCV